MNKKFIVFAKCKKTGKTFCLTKIEKMEGGTMRSEWGENFTTDGDKMILVDINVACDIPLPPNLICKWIVMVYKED